MVRGRCADYGLKVLPDSDAEISYREDAAGTRIPLRGYVRAMWATAVLCSIRCQLPEARNEWVDETVLAAELRVEKLVELLSEALDFAFRAHPRQGNQYVPPVLRDDWPQGERATIRQRPIRTEAGKAVRNFASGRRNDFDVGPASSMKIEARRELRHEQRLSELDRRSIDHELFPDRIERQLVRPSTGLSGFGGKDYERGFS